MDESLRPLPTHPTADLLRSFLNCYWLRPENAFWMTLRSQALAESPLVAPCADLGCGDGIFSFLHCGGRLEATFDVFLSVGRLDHVSAHHADMFDHVDANYRPPITRRPARRLAAGTDIKQNLIDKAAALDVFDQLVLHDGNDPMPFDDGSFATVHSNCAYWIRRIDVLLREVRRVLRPGGRALLSVKLDSMKRYTLRAYREQLGARWLDIIGRARHDTWPSLANHDTWVERFGEAGLSVVAARPFITRTHAHIWDIGLRPIAPLLVRMAQAIEPETRDSIKADWVDLMMELLLPITRADFNLFNKQDEPAEVLFELSPL